jgi:hypothetical protein
VVLNSVVVLHLHTPKEKIWGELVALNAAGITIRGVNLHSFEELLREAAAGEDAAALSTSFYPMYRVEHMAVDESRPGAPSLADRFRQRLGVSMQEFFRVEDAEQ